MITEFDCICINIYVASNTLKYTTNHCESNKWITIFIPSVNTKRIPYPSPGQKLLQYTHNESNI